MKQLSKEQLAEMVYDTMTKVYRANIDNLMKKITDTDENKKDTDSPCMTVIRAMAVFGTEIIQECNQVLVEVLYDILYTE